MALSIEAQFYADVDGVMWEDGKAGRQHIADAEPFLRLPDKVLFAVNDAWLGRFLATFAELADRIERGRVPYPRCVAEEVALWLCIEAARQSGGLEARVGEGTVAQLDDYGDHEDPAILEDLLYQDQDFRARWSGPDHWLGSPTVTALVGTDASAYHPLVGLLRRRSPPWTARDVTRSAAPRPG